MTGRKNMRTAIAMAVLLCFVQYGRDAYAQSLSDDISRLVEQVAEQGGDYE